jgi:hypothetical protein
MYNNGFLFRYHIMLIKSINLDTYLHMKEYSTVREIVRPITHLGDLDISFFLLHISSKFLLPLGYCLLSPKRHTKISK